MELSRNAAKTANATTTTLGGTTVAGILAMMNPEILAAKPWVGVTLALIAAAPGLLRIANDIIEDLLDAWVMTRSRAIDSIEGYRELINAVLDERAEPSIDKEKETNEANE